MRWRAQAEKPYCGFPNYYAFLRDEYTRKRGVLMRGLDAAGLRGVLPQGSFFIMADTSDVEVRSGGGRARASLCARVRSGNFMRSGGVVRAAARGARGCAPLLAHARRHRCRLSTWPRRLRPHL